MKRVAIRIFKCPIEVEKVEVDFDVFRSVEFSEQSVEIGKKKFTRIEHE
jgi:hypothetical protein